jgi:hypothetical protein
MAPHLAEEDQASILLLLFAEPLLWALYTSSHITLQLGEGWGEREGAEGRGE